MGSVGVVFSRALREAVRLPLSWSRVEAALEAQPELVRHADRLALLEGHVRATLALGKPLPGAMRASVVPVLGNVAEAIVEMELVERGWQPVYDDVEGFSFGPGIDLLMLDPPLERLVAVEVKSTIQRGRWPRLSRGGSKQLTAQWLDDGANVGMAQWEIGSEDVYLLVAQVRLRERVWRCCIAADPTRALPVTDEAQLKDLRWLDGA
ncbi:hypothetical protein [Phycicoccus jejuensis]|uniref:hypothetical protein n=1 Tax=Phycicoccus jejuensis TaxID=367299 RepID=UPI0004C3EC29|nr:hypothetical protein [Phycicoccus jejuensis]